MVLPTSQKLTTKQISILKLLAKQRMGSIYHIVYFLYPHLRGMRRNDPEFDKARKAVANILKRLQDNKLIRTARPSKSFDVFYYLSPEGLRAVYMELGITEYDKGRKSGFDFNLGYFEWRIPPYENTHFQFQTDIMATTLSFNREVSIDSLENSSDKWVFGGVMLSNICSIRDNLHAAPRNTDLKEAELYKPDGELMFSQSTYNKDGQLNIETINNTQRIIVEPEYFYVENDLKSEYGERLDSKFYRLNKRLYELHNRNDFRYQKGVLMVLADEQNSSPTQVHLRHMNFVSSFNENCGNFANSFNVITTTISKLPLTLLSMRREFYHSFKDDLSQALTFPTLAKVFQLDSNELYNMDASKGHTLAQYTANKKCLCVFLNIEGLSTVEWKQAIATYNSLWQNAQKHNERVANHEISGHAYKVVPIVCYRKLQCVAPQMINPKLTLREEVSFFENLYVMDIRTSRPVLYKEGKVIDFNDATFVTS
jgi:hypothetical protein